MGTPIHNWRAATQKIVAAAAWLARQVSRSGPSWPVNNSIKEMLSLPKIQSVWRADENRVMLRGTRRTFPVFIAGKFADLFRFSR
jgi:hypothetical protein